MPATEPVDGTGTTAATAVAPPVVPPAVASPAAAPQQQQQPAPQQQQPPPPPQLEQEEAELTDVELFRQRVNVDMDAMFSDMIANKRMTKDGTLLGEP